eukprot:4856945-Amphidinium_carterae.1
MANSEAVHLAAIATAGRADLAGGRAPGQTHQQAKPPEEAKVERWSSGQATRRMGSVQGASKL